MEKVITMNNIIIKLIITLLSLIYCCAKARTLAMHSALVWLRSKLGLDTCAYKDKY